MSDFSAPANPPQDDAARAPTTPAGWYPDPSQPGQQRYWDGTTWTTHSAPGGPSVAGFTGAPTVGYATIGAGPFFVSRMGSEIGPISIAQLQQMVLGKQVEANTMVRIEGGQWFPTRDVPGLFSDKDWTTALILSVLVGSLGVDQFYLGNTGLGVAKLLTCGGLGIWALIDIIRIATNSVTDSRGLPLRK
jgi:TM2 domain/Protein of unknown function (DUF2510)/GYF domain 2